MTDQAVVLPRAVIRQVMDALESDADLDARCAAFEAIQDACEPVTAMPPLQAGDWIVEQGATGSLAVILDPWNIGLWLGHRDTIIEIRKANGTRWVREKNA